MDARNIKNGKKIKKNSSLKKKTQKVLKKIQNNCV